MYHGNSIAQSSAHILNDHHNDHDFDYSFHSKDFRSFKNANLQEIFLNNCRKNGDIVIIHMLAGKARRGTIIGFDNQSIILSDDNSQNLIYKSAIASVVPEEEVRYIFGEPMRKEYCGANTSAVHS